MCSCAVVWTAASPVQGAAVFVNGAKADGLANQTFANCTVQIDAQGNVYIHTKAPMPKVPAAPQAKPAMNGGKPAGQFFLVTEKTAPGMTHYDIDVFINAKWVRKLLDDERHLVVDITKHLHAGKNKIRFIAKKADGAANATTTAGGYFFRVVMGAGKASGRNVMITKKYIDYKRNAKETQSFNDEYTVTVR